MAKDPAFLFYSKDWIEGTAEMLPEEKGVYIDLLAHQHQSGSLPIDTKRLALIARLSHEEFTRIWDSGLSLKFIRSDNRLVNRKLSEVVTDRFSKAIKNKIIGTFAGLLKKLKIDETAAAAIKKQFNVHDFIHLPTETITDRLTEWITKRLPSLGDADAVVNGNRKEGGVGETVLISQTVLKIAEEVWKDQGWRDELCQGLYIKSAEDFRKWMAQFNASVTGSQIEDFTAIRYKRMIRGWIVKQQQKGVTVEKLLEAKEPSQNHLYRNKIS
jgi:uncharacterized protein YdaU (DUF1376 family)